MKFIRHKKMRDVCCEVIESGSSSLGFWKTFKVVWINLLGTYDHRRPFPMGSSKRLAVQELMIRKETFEKEWEGHSDLRSVKASVKPSQC